MTGYHWEGLTNHNSWYDLYLATSEAMALIRENLDVIDWANCLAINNLPRRRLRQVRDPENAVQCVRDYLDGTRSLTLKVEDHPNGYPAWVGSDPDTVHFSTSYGTVRGFDGGVQTAEFTMCALLLHANTIAHEVTHLCGMDHKNVDGFPDELEEYCWPGAMSPSTVMWALSRRYPCHEGRCCIDYPDCMFLSDLGNRWYVEDLAGAGCEVVGSCA